MSDKHKQPIAVLALNPSVDISYEIPQLVPDQKVRAERSYYHPGGNGINVARALTELGMPIHCTSVIGGKGGDLLLRLLGNILGDNHHVFRVVDGETRLNVTLLQKHPRSQYEVDSRGPEIPADVLEAVTSHFLASCGDGIAILTGSVPPGVPDDYYRRLAGQVKAQGGRAVVDAHGPVLKEVLESQPWLIRLNRHVLEMAINRRLESVEAVARAARELQQRGIEGVCISLGTEGAVLVDAGNSYHCTAPRVHVHSTVGCGDALLAGLVTAAHRGENMSAMLCLGVICGTATATHQGTELFSRAEVEETSYEVEQTELGI